MQSNLKKQAFVGVGWNAIGRFSTQGVSFILQIILARLLSPSDYGIIAMISIFLQITAVFVDSGFGKYLVQKQECNDRDFSTVFYYNLLVSLALYLLLYAIAPLVARFYDIDLLINVMRVTSLVVVFNALSIVPRTKLEKSIDFKSQSIVLFLSSLISGLVGIVMAYYGLGVWALCGQTLLNSILQFILFQFFVRWKPSLVFCKQSFSEMFSFGSKIIGASLISVIYSNLYTIIIGKKFHSRDLGYYSRADQLAVFPSSNIGLIISNVAFPVLSNIQNDNQKLCAVYRRIISYSSFVIFPLMIGLSAISEPFVLTVLGETWINSVPYLQILCFALMWDHLSMLNLNLLYVKGKTNLVLKLEIIKKIFAVIILFVTIPFGIMTMCIGRVIYSLVALYINTHYTKKLIGLSLFQQIHDFFPYLALSFGMGVVVYFFSNLFNASPITVLLYGIVIGVILYVSFSLLFFRRIREELMGLLNEIKVRVKSRIVRGCDRSCGKNDKIW
mgnify:CR=1 FL=1